MTISHEPRTREVFLTREEAREIRGLLTELGQHVPVDLVKGLGIVDPDATIEQLRSKFIVIPGRSETRLEWISPTIPSSTPAQPAAAADRDTLPAFSMSNVQRDSVWSGHTQAMSALEVTKVKGITERQEKCIRVLCRKLAWPVPAGVKAMGCKEASECIGKLGKLVDGPSPLGAPTSVQTREAARVAPAFDHNAQVRLGLAAKLVHQQWAATRQEPVKNARETFIQEVMDLYELLGDVQRRAHASRSAR